MISRRAKGYILTAMEESLRSTHSRVRIGAVVVDGNFIVAKGANLATSHPRQYKFNNKVGRDAPEHHLHAEIHALVRSKGYDTSGTEIFVGRMDRRGLMAMCRPCKACAAALKDAGISKVTYTTPQGIKQEVL